MRPASTLALAAACVALPSLASAQVLFSDNFNATPASSYTVAAGPGGNAATFQYDYSTLGIPAAPGNAPGDTIGVRLQANTVAGGITTGLTGLSASPNGQTFTGDYRVRFNAWQNYGGTGTTQLTTYGIGTDGTTAQFPGSVTGLLFGATGDGGSAADYRAYGPGNLGNQLTGVYAAPNTAVPVPPATTANNQQNNTNPYYVALFPGGATSPAVQGPTQTSPAGTPGFTWQTVTIDKVGDTVTYALNGTTIATVDTSAITLGGSNIFLGQSDINAGAASNPNLVFGLFDNLTVTRLGAVPEPTALAAVGVAGAGLLARRRRA